MPESPSALTTMWGCAILGGRRGEGGRSSAAVTIKTSTQGRPDGASKQLTRSLSRNSSWELGYGERRCGFNTKHQSTKFVRDSSPRALCTGGLDPRDLKTALFCISFLRKGEVLAYVGRIHNLKDLKGHSPRAICAVLLDPRDPLLHSERTKGFAADLVYERAKCLPMLGAFKT